MIKKITLLSLSLAIISLNSWAQSLDEFKTKLSQADSLTNAQVIVNEHNDTSEQISNIQSETPSLLNIYRINIFFDNSQKAREDALQAQEKFQSLFSDIPSYLSYENPYFKVTVGNCTSSQEAIILQGKLIRDFPKSFLTRERVEIKTMLE